MATRFDRVITPTRSRERVELDLEAYPLARPEEAAMAKDEARPVPPRSLAMAMLSWFAMIFSICYVAIPVALATLGINPDLVYNSVIAFPAYVGAAVVATMGATAARPSIRLDASGRADHVLAATLGGLGVWAILHNTSALLEPFWRMGPAELASFVALNVLETALLGMMFASFTRRPAVSFALGGGFQLLVVGLFLTFVRALLVL